MSLVLQGFSEEVRHWDVTFWAERLREAKYEISDEQLRPYFSLPNVLQGLFQVGWVLILLWKLQRSSTGRASCTSQSEYFASCRQRCEQGLPHSWQL